MFHCLVIKVVSLSSLCDSLFTLSYLSNLVKHFFKSFSDFQDPLKSVVSVVLFKRLDFYHKFSHLSTVNLNFLINLFIFQYFYSEAILATACLLYHCRRESSSTLQKKFIFFCSNYLSNHVELFFFAKQPENK